MWMLVSFLLGLSSSLVIAFVNLWLERKTRFSILIQAVIFSISALSIVAIGMYLATNAAEKFNSEARASGWSFIVGLMLFSGISDKILRKILAKKT